MGRKQNDVFVLGDESLLTETIGVGDSGSAGIDDGEGLAAKLLPPDSVSEGAVLAAPSSSPRRLAVLGLGAGAAVVSAAASPAPAVPRRPPDPEPRPKPPGASPNPSSS